MSSHNSSNGALETGPLFSSGLVAVLAGSARILLASHSTDGAQAAEKAAMELCVDRPKSSIHHVIVVPKALWHGMTGDDWLNNGSTRNTFCRYVESTLQKEIDEQLNRLKTKIDALAIQYSYEVIVGEPEESLIAEINTNKYDVVVMGSPRPKGKSGLRSRMRPDQLVKSINTPLLIVPYPKDI